MDITYTVIGTDGQQYGPITLDQLKVWVSEGRLARDTKVLRSDTNAWLAAAEYPELDMNAPPVAPAVISAPPLRQFSAGLKAGAMLAAGNPVLERRAKSGANWFYWIAALSLINTLMALTQSGFIFLFGLGITQIIDGFASNAGSGGNAVGLVFNIIVAGVFALFGVFARKGHAWSFIAGMVFYLLDGLLLVLVAVMDSSSLPVLPLIVHAYVLFRLFTGMQANNQLKKLGQN